MTWTDPWPMVLPDEFKIGFRAVCSKLKNFCAERESPVILNLQRKNVEPGIVVLEMNGRIAMGSDSQKIEWGLAELLKENQEGDP